ncbi:MAG: LysM peptidoglycan-binding domain-containing protein [Betaproteobacteria bacterium]
MARHGIARTLLAAAAALPVATALAQTMPDGRFPVTPEQRRAAEPAAQAGVPLSELAPNAPDSHTVKRGDTLWGISGIFLKSPWRWPELWGMNKAQIANPHLIYPGQVLRLVKSDGRARLELAGSAATPAASAPGDVVRLSPRTREEELGAAAIPSIPNHLIEPFLSRPLVVEADGLDAYPRIVATQEGRVYLGRGDTAYARGVTDPAVKSYNVFRTAQPLFDPDDTARRRPIAYEAFFLGTVAVTKTGDDVTTLRIVDSKQEIGEGDRLIPVERLTLASYVPRRPQQQIDARIVSVYGGLDNAAGGSVVTLNRGRADGLEVGDVLALLQVGGTITDRTVRGWQSVELPDERIGEVFVFRVFDHIAYALVVRSTVPVKVGDRLREPDDALVPRAQRMPQRQQDLPARTRLDAPDPDIYRGQ